jgi:hypothetical protein
VSSTFLLRPIDPIATFACECPKGYIGEQC